MLRLDFVLVVLMLAFIFLETEVNAESLLISLLLYPILDQWRDLLKSHVSGDGAWKTLPLRMSASCCAPTLGVVPTTVVGEAAHIAHMQL